ncbi:MAG: hypothetical protein RJA59_1188 [Pseudomonadota bacterium]|jgi:hypothetical protein
MRLLAYCARYGHQPLSELRALSHRDLRRFHDELVAIVRRENASGHVER